MNLTLDGLESLLAEHFPPRRGHLVKLVRFADDFAITGKTKELLEEEVRPLTAEFLNQRGLKLSKSKTRITHIEEGFDFLGKRFQKHGGKLLIKPSRQNVQAFLTGIKATFRENLHAPVERLLMGLNPKIRGSPLMANVALHGMEEMIASHFPRSARKRFYPPRVIRYADDVVVLHEDRQVIEQIRELIEKWLQPMGLRLKPAKTRITHILDNSDEQPGFDFLGFNIRQ